MRPGWLDCALLIALATFGARPAFAQRVLTRAPVAKYVEAPVIPEDLADFDKVVVVRLEVELGLDGSIVRVTSTDTAGPRWVRLAIETVSKYRFSPAEVDGKPAAIRFTYLLELAPPAKAAIPAPLTPPRAPAGPGPVTIAPSAPRPTPPAERVETIQVRSQKETQAIGATTLQIGAGTRAIAGSLGDGLTVAQSLPGIVRPPAGANQLVVWGAAPAESRIYVDDVPIPYLYHRGGLRSVLGADFVQSLELSPAGFGAAYGRATGGLLRLRTTTLNVDGAHGHVAADPIDASASFRYKQREKDGPWAFAVGGRYGYFDRVLRAVAPNTSFPASAYADAAAKLVYRGEKSVTELSVMGSLDDTTRAIPDPRSARPRSDRTLENFGRLFLRHTEGASSYLIWVGRDSHSSDASFAGATAGQSQASMLGGARISSRVEATTTLTWRFGVDVEVSRHDLERSGTASLPAREGDPVVFGQAPAQRINRDAWTNHNVGAAPYTEVDWNPTAALRVVPGLRIETLVLEGSRIFPRAPGGVDVGRSLLHAFADPRLLVEYRASKMVSLRAAGGIYHRAPDPLDTSAVFGSPSLVPSRSAHVLVGAKLQPNATFEVEWALFAKRSDGLAVRTAANPEPLAENLTSTGGGTSFGGQAVLRVREFKTVSGWASYTLSRSERQDGDARPPRPFDFDQPHAVTLVASTTPVEGWTFGLRLRAASGYPRVKILGAYFDARTGAYQPIREGRERLPTFVQLDLHGERAWRFGSARAVLYLDVVNVVARENPEEIVYGFDYRERGFLTSYPFFAVLGARGEL